MPKNEKNQYSVYDDKKFKKFEFKKQSLEKIKREYFNGIISQYRRDGKHIDDKTILKANKEAYIYTQNIFRGPYKKLLSYQSKENRNIRNPINENLWDKAEDIYENQKRKTIEILARIGLVALVGGAAAIGISRTKNLAAPNNEIKIEEQQDQKEKMSTDEKSKDSNEIKVGKIENSSKPEFINSIKGEEDATEKANEELESKRGARDYTENKEFYRELLDEYNARTPDNYAKIRQKDTRIVELSGKRFVNYGFRKSGELVYVDDMFIKEDEVKKNQLQVADEFPSDYIYVLDIVNQRVIAAAAYLDDQVVNVVSNYYQGSSRTVYVNPFGVDIGKALILPDVLNRNPSLFQAARDSGTEEIRAVEALRGVKKEIDDLYQSR